jgi:hypothetical protein
MKRYNKISAIAIVLFMIPLFSITAFANSSWHWLTDTRPIYILPIVIIATLFIEIYSISYVCKIKPKNIACSITLANVASFAMPYLFEVIKPNQLYSFSQITEHTPMFTVGIVYLVMTIIIELPVVYFSLRKNVESKKRLLATIIITNTVTTSMVAIIERIVCVGKW